MQRPIVLILLLVLSSASGKAQKIPGNVLRGQVTDQAGAAVKAARVALKAHTKETRIESTNGEGRFTFDGLADGRYLITVEAAGFATYQDDILVEAANPDQIKIVLNVATLKGEVEVNGERNALSAETGGNVIVLRGDIIKRLPRDERQLMLLLERMAGRFGR